MRLEISEGPRRKSRGLILQSRERPVSQPAVQEGGREGAWYALQTTSGQSLGPPSLSLLPCPLHRKREGRLHCFNSGDGENNERDSRSAPDRTTEQQPAHAFRSLPRSFEGKNIHGSIDTAAANENGVACRPPCLTSNDSASSPRTPQIIKFLPSQTWGINVTSVA